MANKHTVVKLSPKIAEFLMESGIDYDKYSKMTWEERKAFMQKAIEVALSEKGKQ